MIPSKDIRSSLHIIIVLTIFLHFSFYGEKVVAVVLTGNDLNYACTTYLKFDGKMNETIWSLREHLSPRLSDPNTLDQDLSTIEQVIRVIVNSPSDLTRSGSILANSPGPLFAGMDSPEVMFQILTPHTVAYLPFGGTANAITTLASFISQDKEEEAEVEEEEDNFLYDDQDEESDQYASTRASPLSREETKVNRSLDDRLKLILKKIEPKMLCNEFSFPDYLDTKNFEHINRLKSDMNQQRGTILANYILKAKTMEIN